MQGGLLLIDRLGTVMRIYDRANGLEDPTITAIYRQHNDFWLGTPSGLYFFDKRVFIRHPQFPSLQINDLRENGGVLYLATPIGLYGLNLRNKSIQNIEISGFKGAVFSLETFGETLFMGTSQGLISFNPVSRATRFLGVREGLPVGTVLSLNYTDGFLYIGTMRGLRIATADLSLLNITLPPEVRNAEITSLASGVGFVFAGTNSGVVRITRNNWSNRLVFAGLSPLSSNRITALLRFRGELLLGTSRGLYLFNEELNVLTEIIKEVEVNDIVQLADDGFIATSSGLYRYQLTQKRITDVYDVRQGLFHNQVMDLVVDEEQLLLATKLGVQQFDPLRRRFEAYFLKDVLCLLVRDDFWYAGTINGLFRKPRHAGEFVRITTSGAPTGAIRSMVSLKNNILLATGGVVLEFNPQTLVFKNLNIPFTATILKLDEAEDYLFYLTDNGLYLYDGLSGHTTGLNTLDYLPSATILSFLKDGDRVYIGTGSGLFRQSFRYLSRAVFFDTTYHPLRRIVESASKAELIAGFPDGSFRPNQVTSKAQFATMLVKAMGINPARPIFSSFTDVATTHWASPFLEELVRRRVLVAGGRFNPQQEIKRQDVAEWVALALKLTFQRPTTPSFKDVTATHPYYLLIEAVFRERIFLGTPAGNFLPHFPLSRVEAVTILMRIRDEGI